MAWRQLLMMIVMGVWVLPGCASHNRASRSGIISQELPLTVDDLSEIKEGEANHKRVMWQYNVYKNKKLQTYCDLIAAEIAEVSTRPHLPYHVTLLDTEEVNIFGGPGGYIYITKGMFKYLKSEGELAGILAHEITHVANYEYSNIPHLTKVKRAYGLMLAGSELVKNTGMAGPYGSATNMVLSEGGKRAPMVFKRFTADQEVATDEKAIESLARAGYDPHDYQDFVERLSKVNMDEVARFVLLMNSHPPFEQRRKILDGRVRSTKFTKEVQLKEELVFDFTKFTEVPPPAPAAPLPPPAETAKSIIFQPKFRAVTDQSPVIEPVTAPKQENKIRKRMSTAWF